MTLIVYYLIFMIAGDYAKKSDRCDWDAGPKIESQ